MSWLDANSAPFFYPKQTKHKIRILYAAVCWSVTTTFLIKSLFLIVARAFVAEKSWTLNRLIAAQFV